LLLFQWLARTRLVSLRLCLTAQPRLGRRIWLAELELRTGRAALRPRRKGSRNDRRPGQERRGRHHHSPQPAGSGIERRRRNQMDAESLDTLSPGRPGFQAVPFKGDRQPPAGGMNWAPFNDPAARNARDPALRLGSSGREDGRGSSGRSDSTNGAPSHGRCLCRVRRGDPRRFEANISTAMRVTCCELLKYLNGLRIRRR